MAEFTVTFLPDNSSVTVASGTPLLHASREAGLRVQSPCGGQGRCGKCLVHVRSGWDCPTSVETRILSLAQLDEGWRLACQTRVVGDTLVTVPESSLAIEHRIMVDGAEREVLVEPNVRKVSLRLPAPSVDDPRADLHRVMEALGEGALPPSRLEPLQDLPSILRTSGYEITAVLSGGRLAAIEAGDTTEQTYGLALDVGTTTVVAYLCHLPTGAAVAVASDLNSQAQYGHDVISRIQAATSDPEDLRGLNRAIIAVINDLVARACHEGGVSPDAIYEIAAVGNTCMTHLLLGVSPAGLGSVPFVPSFRSAQTVRAADLGIDVNPHGSVYVAPNIGSFVGADTVGLMLASELDRGDGLRIAVDIGTNGEIVVARGGELYACSTAAGPAFEGAKIRCGMRASLGAIDAVRIDDDVDCHVIGDVRPRGLCGSGLVDVIAELVRVGAVAETGRMLTREEASSLPEKVRERLTENDGGMEFVLARADEAYAGEPIALTARDVREMQLAKAAIYGGMELMLHQVGAEPGDVEQLLLAGAFGNYIRRESALAIGLIPSVAAGRIASVGNAAGVGARLMLCSLSERRRAQEIARNTRHVELSEREGFYDRFADAMMLRPLPAER